jgi:FtsZ-interacting cell division protein YlmF
MRLKRRGHNRTDAEPVATPPTSGSMVPHLIRPGCPDDMVEVGKRLKHGESVLLDLGALSDPVKRRMLDACAGLVYGFDASMTRIMEDRYTLEPPSERPGHDANGAERSGRARSTEQGQPTK